MKKGYSAEWLTKEDFEIAKQNGISYDAAYKRFYQYKWSREKAITHPIFPQFQNKKPRKSIWWEYADRSVVCRNTFEYRMKQGLSADLAASIPSQKKK